MHLDEAVAAHTQLPVLSLARCSSASPSVAGRFDRRCDHLRRGCVSLCKCVHFSRERALLPRYRRGLPGPFQSDRRLPASGLRARCGSRVATAPEPRGRPPL